MIKLYSDLRTDSCCKNMDNFADNLYMSIKILCHVIALNRNLGTYTEEYIQELTSELELLKGMYGRLYSLEDLEDILQED